MLNRPPVVGFLSLLQALACTNPPPPPVVLAPIEEAAPAPKPVGPDWVAQSLAVKAVYREIVRSTLVAKGGTFQPPDFAPIEVGMRAVAVSLEGGATYPVALDQAELSVHLSEFVGTHPELLSTGNYLGTWVSGSPETVAYDVTRLFLYGDVDSRLVALAEANALGVKNHQKCVFDIGEGQSFAVDAKRKGGKLEACPG